MAEIATRAFYKQLQYAVQTARSALERPLTLSEKILYAHLDQSWAGRLKEIQRGKSAVKLRPDRVAMQDATAQMAMLQFMQAQRPKTAVPSSIHCDHLIRAFEGAAADIKVAQNENAEVYDFLASSASKYGIDFWKPGSGIIHQAVLENYAFPGGMMIGTDSHTPNAGGLAMVAVGVGGADAAEVMAGLAWDLVWPKLVGIRLTGSLTGWTAPKDIILKVAGLLTVKGGTGKIVEYFGPGVRSISATGRATITNMGAELGATTSLFPFDSRSVDYVRKTGRDELADAAEEVLELFKPDPEVESDAEKYYDELITIDLDTLEPYMVGPYTPDLARPISELAAEVREKGYPDNIKAALLGSCTNSSYEDIGRAAHVAEQAISRGMKAVIPFMITPGSEAVYETVRRDGLLQKLEALGGLVLANACGPCIGQWKRVDVQQNELNTIVTSFNRNFRGRNDANMETMAFMSSPEIVTAYALSGSLSFNPLKDPLTGSGGPFVLSAPTAADLPAANFSPDRPGLVKPSPNGHDISIAVSPDSERLALLTPFARWNGEDFKELPLLLKAVGKCTTDAISPAGKWLRYRGHLDRISDNMFSGAVNAFGKETGKGLNILTGERDTFPKIARHYKSQGLGWAVVGDENYGEGSSREHAAMSPRYLGAKAVIVKSFARIHETNLKKQGVLALMFVDPADYDKVQEKDRVSITGLKDFAPGKNLTAILHHEDGTKEQIALKHSFTEEQIGWFKRGAALNPDR